MAGVIERARADLAAGRGWKARDRLAGALVDRADDELLELLGDVYFAMGDLPAAGAVWFGSTRTGQDVEAAEGAWRERYGRDDLQLWLSLPPRVRGSLATPAVQSLHDAAVTAASARRVAKRRLPRGTPLTKPRVTAGGVLGALLGLVAAGVLVIGLISIAGWIGF
jgi:hypothetical protein